MEKSPPLPICRLGRRLRLYRRIHGIKQAHLAEALGVSQGLVSRWESGYHEPSSPASTQIIEFLSARAEAKGDRALRQLVERSSVPVHLICDMTHTLLAASRARQWEWGADALPFIGSSLWKFATDAIVSAELELEKSHWFDDAGSNRVLVRTAGNNSRQMRILPSQIDWEQIGLSDGRVGRLVTTISFG